MSTDSIDNKPPVLFKRKEQHKPNNLIAVDFSSKPNVGEILEWDGASKIDRKNFCSFLIKSFGESFGRPYLQEVIFKWAEENLQFDCNKTFTEFLKVDPWGLLTAEEQGEFINAFQIEPHTNKKEAFRQDPNNSLHTQLDTFTKDLLIPRDFNLKGTDYSSLKEQIRAKLKEEGRNKK